MLSCIHRKLKPQQRKREIFNSCKYPQQSHRRSHLERVETDAAPAVDIWVVNGRYESNLGRFEGIPGEVRAVGYVGLLNTTRQSRSFHASKNGTSKPLAVVVTSITLVNEVYVFARTSHAF